MFKCITRDGSSPQGKARVYFCCHPEDFERYFKPITEEIFKYQNCTFYYVADPGEPYDEQKILSDIREMQLFVMPVTGRLLFQKSRAIEIEFPFAKDEHIPVLPLMQEPNLEEIFNKKCGNLQFLNKYKRDDTSIKYEEKLEKYLSGVLIGDEMAEKIRNAFDAYVFLSYRKKDRKYAQELMRLIHKNDFCRDIAIWYDEFLNPGENFNSAIEEVLKKSKLFALAVTPNLVNEENYIITKEYPLAKEADKRIIPAELEKTDRKLIEDKFDGIPPCIDAYNEPELSRELLNAFKDIAIRKNDIDPQHNFFIGLAYLDGIDVERNNKRALELITSSANADLPEAMEKLVSLYRSGKGVETDYKAAIEWQKRLVEYYKKVFEKDKNKFSKLNYLSLIYLLGVYYQEYNMFTEASEVFLLIIRKLKRSNKNSLKIFKTLLASCYQNLGIIYKNSKRYNEAAIQYFYARELLTELSKANDEYRLLLAMNYSDSGVLYREKGEMKNAEEMYLQSLKIFNKKKARYSPEYKLNLAGIYSNLGCLYGDMCKITEAEKAFRSAIKILDQELSYQNKKSLAMCYNNLGVLYRNAACYQKAESAHKKASEIYRGLVGVNIEADNPDIARNFNNLGSLYKDMQNFKKSKEALLEANKILKHLSDIYPMIYKEELALSYNSLGSVYYILKNFNEAEYIYEHALEIFMEMREKKREISELGLVCSYMGLAMIYRETNRYKKAESALLLALKSAKYLGKINSEEYENGLLEIYSDLVILYKQKQRLKKASRIYVLMIEILIHLSEKRKADFEPTLAEIYMDLGLIYAFMYFELKKTDDDFFQKAKVCFEKAKELFEKYESCATDYEKVSKLLEEHFS